MLLTMVEILCCDNPKCRDFARVAPNPHRLRSYYCPICNKVSSIRVVDVRLADSHELLKAYLLDREVPAEAASTRDAEVVWY